MFTQFKNLNLFVQYLTLLKVKHTNKYASKVFNEHPDKYNLYGFHNSLEAFNIKSSGIRIKNKPDILKLSPPFIAQMQDSPTLVTHISNEKIHYLWKNHQITSNLGEFYSRWTGIVLLAEPDETSIEPGYKKNLLHELYPFFLKIIVLFGILYISLSSLFNQPAVDYYVFLSLFINITGLYICYLLILKQFKIQSEAADKICSLLKQKSCNNILESKAAKLFGLIGWSEVGLGYFISNLIIFLFFPYLIKYSILINLCALPYSFWSIWYQKRTGQWCVLCLCIQAILWIIFAINLVYWESLIFNQRPISELLSLFFIYLLPFAIISLLVPIFEQYHKSESVLQEYNSLKSNKNVFTELLSAQPQYPTAPSNILFGNRNAELEITILTNPHCQPCSLMHERIEKLLCAIPDNICIKYVFSSFSNQFDNSAKALIQIYQQNDEQTTRQVFTEWFTKGKHNKSTFFDKYGYIPDDPESNEEFIKHFGWQQAAGLTATPTILINKHLLPPYYNIEDLIHLTNSFN